MPTISQGAPAYFLTLEAGNVLTVAADAISVGVLRTYPTTVGGEASESAPIAPGQTITKGPLLSPTRYCIEAVTGSIQYSIDKSSGAAGGGAGGGSVAVEQSASQVISAASALNFGGGLAVSAAGSKATVQITPQAIVTPVGVTGIPGYNGYRPAASPRETAPPVVRFPKAKNLAMFFSPSSVNTVVNSGNVSVTSDYSDPYIAEAWNGSNSANGGAATIGQSMRVGWIANSDIVVSRATAIANADDITGKNIYIQIKMVSGTNPGTMRIRLYTAGQLGASSANYWQAEVLYPFGGMLKSGSYWQTFAVPAANFTAVGTPGAITGIVSAGVQITGSAAGAMLIGRIFSCPNLLTKGAVIIGFDDNRSDTWIAASRVLGNRGFPAVLYPGAIGSGIRSANDEYNMTIRQLKRLQDDYSWQVASQAWDTENPNDTLQEFAAKMSAMRAFYEAEGFYGGADGSYFSNVSMGSSRDEVFRKCFRTMRSFNIWNPAEVNFLRAECTPTPDPYNLFAFGVDTSGHTAAHMQTLVDKAISQKGVMRFVFHGITETNPTFVGLVDYLDAQRANVDVMTEAQLQHRLSVLAFA